MSDRNRVDPDGGRGEEDPGGLDSGETIFRIYYMREEKKKQPTFNRRKKR